MAILKYHYILKMAWRWTGKWFSQQGTYQEPESPTCNSRWRISMIPALGRQTQADPCNSKADQSSWISKPWIHERPCVSEIKVERDWERYQMFTSGIHNHASLHVNTHTCTQHTQLEKEMESSREEMYSHRASCHFKFPGTFSRPWLCSSDLMTTVTEASPAMLLRWCLISGSWMERDPICLVTPLASGLQTIMKISQGFLWTLLLVDIF